MKINAAFLAATFTLGISVKASAEERILTPYELQYGGREGEISLNEKILSADQTAAKVLAEQPEKINDIVYAVTARNDAIRILQSHFYAVCGPYNKNNTKAMKDWTDKGVRQCRIPIWNNATLDCWNESGEPRKDPAKNSYSELNNMLCFEQDITRFPEHGMCLFQPNLAAGTTRCEGTQPLERRRFTSIQT